MKVRVGEREVDVPEGAEVRALPDGSLRVTVEGRTVTAFVVGDAVWIDGRVRRVAPAVARPAAPAGNLSPPMPGTVTRVFVAVGDTVKAGDRVLAISAMKLETVLRAPRDGVVKAIRVAVGATVRPGDTLVDLDPLEGP